MMDDKKYEIEELDRLIEENKRLLIKYPDKLSLQLGLESLEDRKKHIESEQ